MRTAIPEGAITVSLPKHVIIWEINSGRVREAVYSTHGGDTKCKKKFG
jgi:hypothetical protein